MGKRGAFVKIRDLKSDLKRLYGLNEMEITSNLTYLLSQKWIEEKPIQKQVRTNRGVIIPSTTNYYAITAQGIDKIEGTGEFTPPRLHGINIQATGQNIITVGDGNQVNIKFSELGESLAELRNVIINSKIQESDKLNIVTDIDTIQAQLAKPEPNKGIIKTAWESIKAGANIEGCITLVEKISSFIKDFL